MNTLTKKRKTKKVKKTSSDNGNSGWNKFLNALQELGKSLQFPIAVLPFAAILARFGALGVSYTSVTKDGVLEITNAVGYWISFIIQKPGSTVFDNLPLIFAIGVAFGLAKDHRGEVALVGAVFYLILMAMTMEHSLPEMMYKNVLTFTYHDGDKSGTLSKLIYVENYSTDGKKTIVGGTYVLNVGVLGGIVAGVLSAVLYNKFKDIKLPVALSFFGGRRFVPMMGIIVSIPTALGFAILWPWLQYVLMLLGQQIAQPTNPAVAIPGTALYGFLNRLLLPFGLHQIMNTFFWFQLPIGGEQIKPITGEVNNPGSIMWVNGDINAFTAGVAGSGLFQSGFFPIMMGGVPAIAVAMILAAKKENRKEVAGFLGGVAVVSLVSGITEPIEFSFVFLSPLLLILHSLLTAIFVAITTAMRIEVGFGFSAGLIDYCISIPQAWGFAAHNTGAFRVTANPLWILLLAALAFGVYLPVFYYTITKMDIKTPGREDDLPTPANGVETDSSTSGKVQQATKSTTPINGSKEAIMASEVIAAIGANNFVSVDNCATRLRLILKDNSKVDDARIKAAGAFGVKRLGKEAFQIVVGPAVEHVAEEVKKQLASQPTTVEEVVVENSTQPKIAKAKIKVSDHKTTKTAVEAENSTPSKGSTGSKDAVMAQQIIEAIGVDNFVSVDNCATRLRLVLNDNTKVDEAKIKASGAYGTKRFADGRFWIIIGPGVELVANEVKKQLKAAGATIELN